MKDLQRLGLPLLLIIATAILNRFILNIFYGEAVNLIVRLLVIFVLFWLGVLLNPHKGGKAVFRKVLAIVLLIFMVSMEMGWLSVPAVSNAFTFLGLEGLYFNLLYVYCGYLFSDN